MLGHANIELTEIVSTPGILDEKEKEETPVSNESAPGHTRTLPIDRTIRETRTGKKLSFIKTYLETIRWFELCKLLHP